MTGQEECSSKGKLLGCLQRKQNEAESNPSQVHAVHTALKNVKVQSGEGLRPRPSLHMAEACKGTQTLSLLEQCQTCQSFSV